MIKSLRQPNNPNNAVKLVAPLTEEEKEIIGEGFVTKEEYDKTIVELSKRIQELETKLEELAKRIE